MELHQFEHKELDYKHVILGEFSLAHLQAWLHFSPNSEKQYEIVVRKWLSPQHDFIYSFYDLEDAMSTFELLYYTNEEALGTSPHVYDTLNTAEEELNEHLHKGYN